MTDKEMVMHSCRADGAILRTTEQLAMLDAGLREGFADLLEFDVWSASTVIDDECVCERVDNERSHDRWTRSCWMR